MFDTHTMIPNTSPDDAEYFGVLDSDRSITTDSTCYYVYFGTIPKESPLSLERREGVYIDKGGEEECKSKPFKLEGVFYGRVVVVEVKGSK